MHTLMVLAAGFALLGVCLIAGRMAGVLSRGALVFIPLWFVAAAVNMWIGVAQAGYSVAAELPMFALVFGIPALVAFWLWRRYR